MSRTIPGIAAAIVLVVLAACTASPTPSPTEAPPTATLPQATATPAATSVESAPATAEPTATPEPPPLSLEPPDAIDPRQVSVSVLPEVGADGGRITVTVTSLADERIDDLVLRWPTELAETLFLAPFVPSQERIAEGGPPLVQPWTKWVVGPGEQGEPAGTTSLGYGPLLPGATLEIPIFVTRVAAGPVGFDLQVLAGNDLLTLDGGAPALLRVEVP